MTRTKHSSTKSTPTDALNYLASAFSVPNGDAPCICAKALEPMIRDVHAGFNDRFMREPYHTLWASLLSFLLAPRSQSQLTDLSTTLSTCSCPIELRRYHNTSLPQSQYSPTNVLMHSWTDQTDFERAMQWAFALLWEAFSRIDKKRTGKADSKEYWPTCPEDLLPWGPDAATESLVQWTRTLNTLAPLGVLGYIMDVCRGLIFPSLEASTTLGPCFLEVPWTMCRTTVHAGRHDFSAVRMFHHELSFLNKFYTVFFWHATPIFLPLLQNQEINLLQQTSLILHIFTQNGLLRKNAKEKGADELEGIVYVAQHVIYRLPVCKLPRKQHMLIRDTRALDAEDKKKGIIRDSIFHTTFGSLKFAKDQTVCHARGCTNSLATVGGQLRRCARCTVAAYCSTECQRSSWSDSERPHKAVCRKIAGMLEVGGGLKEDGQVFAARCRMAGIPKEDADVVNRDCARWDQYGPLPEPENLTGEEDYEELVDALYKK